MNDCERYILQYVADGKLKDAQTWLGRLVATSKAKSTEKFFQRLQESLDKSAKAFVELPPNLQGLLRAEQPSLSLIDKRYIPSEEDKKIIGKLSSAYKAKEMLKNLCIDYVNGAIFHGPSGCGKTSFGRYIASTLNLPFVYLDFSGAVASLLGQTASNLSRAFEWVKAHPCVFMIDEVDAIGSFRTSGDGATAEMNRVVITLMQCIDRFDCESILLFATNRIDILDSALLRRIPLHYEMHPMEEERKIKMVAAYLATIPETTYNDAGIRKFLRDCVEETNNSYIINALIQWIVAKITNGERIRMIDMEDEELSLF